MTVPFYQVNAFTKQLFCGNVAGVCLMPGTDVGNGDGVRAAAHETALLQRIATEINLPATAFVSRQGEDFALRWFSPTKELPLCGHGTLGAAHVLREFGWLTQDAPARLHTMAGVLTVRVAPGEGLPGDGLPGELLPADWIELEFPAFGIAAAALPPSLAHAFPTPPRQVAFAHDRYLVELESESAVRDYEPDFDELKEERVCITALADPGKPYDFVSRFFAVSLGVYEDAVTGSAHCALTPYWAARLDKHEMTAYQASSRGGLLKVRLLGDHVFIAGQALTVLKGEMLLPE